MRRTLCTIALFAACFAYALARYVGFKNVPWEDVPLYVTNKAVSLVALVLMGLATFGGRNRRWMGMTGLGLALLHVLMTGPILTPAYFPKLFLGPGPTLTWVAGVALLLGATALVMALAQAWLSSRILGRAVIAAVGIHCAALGFAGWWPPSSWPGYMPPITLLAVVFVAGVCVRWAGRETRP